MPVALVFRQLLFRVRRSEYIQEANILEPAHKTKDR